MVRIKHRYILFEILYPPTADTRVTPREDFNQFSQSELNALLTLHQSSPNSINVKTILNVIRKSLLDHYGDVGAGKAGMLLNVKYFSNRTSTGILRCGRDQSDYIIGAMSLIEKMENNYVIIRCLHVSGTIKKCEEYSIERTKQLINAIKNKSKGKVDEYISQMNEINHVEEDKEEEQEEKNQDDVRISKS